ncbi:hypothetical protein A2U01_0063772, partial [Trifolium medium]|nr:hypothetical protein [Trifolium medium]
MIKSPAWSRITTYAAENRMKMAMEAIEFQPKNMVVEANFDSQKELAVEANDSGTSNKQ